MATINNVKDFIYEYARYVHLDQMPAGVKARFADYRKNKSFAKDMKYWPDILDDIEAGEWPALSDDNLEKLYDMFQTVFENMAGHQDDFKLKTETTKPFFEKWFGRGKLFEPSQPISGADAEITRFVQQVLENPTYKNEVSKIFTGKGEYNFGILPEDMKYDDFVSKVKKGDYKTNLELRGALIRAIRHTQDYSGRFDEGYGPAYWPTNMPAYRVAPQFDPDPETWFKHKYNPAFKYRLPELFGKLVSSTAVFNDFKTYDSKGVISGKISKAITDTDYANSESENFVPEKDNDEKNFFQRVEDKIDDIKQNNIDPWTNVLRGTRRFFTPYAKNIIEACSKVKTKDGKKLKPTDGLQGILGCKDDIAKKIEAKDPKARAHWKWISGKLAAYSASVPKAFEGALRNPKQLKKIVSKFIIDGVKEGKIAEAKTALEMLSTLKYGIMHSRTVDALGKESWTLWSDKGLSWNKYEGVKFVTTAFDKTVKFAGLALGRGVAALHNKWFRDNTKFRGNDKLLKSEHDLWKNRNNIAQNEQLLANLNSEIANANNDYAMVQNDIMAAGYRNHDKLRQDIDAKKADREAKNHQFDAINAVLAQLEQQSQQSEQTMRDALGKRNSLYAEITRLENTINEWTNVVLPGLTDPDDIRSLKQKIFDKKMKLDNKKQEKTTVLDNAIHAVQDFRNKRNAVAPQEARRQALENDIRVLDNFITPREAMSQDFQTKKQNVLDLKAQKMDAQQEHDDWKDDHKDKYMELMAYWDMLESFGKSHQFTLAADLMRKKFLKKNAVTGKSKAETVTADFLTKYQQRYAA